MITFGTEFSCGGPAKAFLEFFAKLLKIVALSRGE
jgi:hypothetical protein